MAEPPTRIVTDLDRTLARPLQPRSPQLAVLELAGLELDAARTAPLRTPPAPAIDLLLPEPAPTATTVDAPRARARR